METRSKDVFERPKVFYDIEVFKHDWMICFEFEDGTKRSFHNKGRIHIMKIIKNYTLVGFNNYFYDDKIITKIFKGFMKPEEIKTFNDAIIVGGEEICDRLSGDDVRYKKDGSRYPFWFVDFDVVSLDCYRQSGDNVGLKTIEGRSGANIKESDIPFDIDRPLTDEEVEEVLGYCFYDVTWAKNTYNARSNYWNLKEFLYKETGETKPQSYRWNTTSATKNLFTGFRPLEEKIYPKLELWNKLPEKVRFMFENDTMEKITIDTRTSHIIFSDGGGHGTCKPEYGLYFEDVELWDVKSLYPSIMINYNMFGELTETLIHWLEYRLQLLEEGNPLQETYKLLINSLYGLTGDKYDEEGEGVKSTLLRKSVCMIGQTCLYDLAIRLEEAGCTLVNVNTDGVGFINPDNLDILYIKGEWEQDWNLQLDIDKFIKFYQKDVNNYIGITPKGKLKLKGGDVKKAGLAEIKPGEVVLQNNNYSAVDYALKEFLVNKVPGEESFRKIFEHSGLQPFCRLFNVNKSYKDLFGVRNGDVTHDGLQKVNRIVAVSGEDYKHEVAKYILIKDVEQYKGYRYIKDDITEERLPDMNSEIKWRDLSSTLDRKEIELNFETRVIERMSTVPRTNDNMLLVNDEIINYDLSFEDLDLDFYMEELETRIKRWT